MYQVWDNSMFLFYCDEYEIDLYSEQGFSVVFEDQIV